MSFKLFNLDEQYFRHPEVRREEVLKLLAELAGHWSLAQKHLPTITEHEALLFYFACKCSMENAKMVLDLNFTCRTHFEEFFGNVDVATPEMELVRETVAGFPLQQQTPEGYTVVVINILDPDVSKFNFINSIKLYSIGQDKWMLEKGVMSGLIFVLDMSNLTFGHITRIGISALKKVMYYLQEAIPGRLVGLHFINTSKIIDKLMAILNPLMKKELMEMIHVHSSMDSFYKFVPREILPREYGGSSGTIRELYDIYFEFLLESRQEIIDYNNNHRVNEKLRPAKSKPNSELFGTEGNFKKLDID
ncbi:retinaldehyde-binding protein 1-like [Musca vetustissima]|uniref:retinaldehyde-binding protein 1-like n=1 Tax=Musca vetustissima TaxID=27455 RepID=UPI002AB77776|nr:retinaldehyde-binding protein 1-like [Musca vetustissima]